MNKPYKSTHGLNSLTLRLIGVNILALLLIGIGVLQTGQFRTAVISTELSLLQTEIKIIAAALSSSVESEDRIKELSPLIDKLSAANHRSILIFDKEGLPKGFARSAASQEKQEEENFSTLEYIVNAISVFIPIEYNLQIYKESTSSPHLAPDRTPALKGDLSVSAWQTPDGRLVFSAGAPIYKNEKIIGAVVVIKDETQTEAAMLQTRVDMARIIFAIFVITAIMLIYFAAVVGRPLNRLVEAADRIRNSRSRSVEIPNLSYRNDEIGTLSVAFRDMTSALWTRMDSIESFASDVAHELKNPLTSMRSAIETLPRAKDDTQRTKLTDILSHDILRMDRLITDISRASRVDAELSREIVQIVDVQKLAQDMEKTFQNECEKKKVQLNVHTSKDGTFLTLASQSRLAQVFENLITNALSFSPAQSTIHIKFSSANNKLNILFEDEGPGIPQGKEEKIFERFYSERPAKEKFGEHSGLGLAICRQIITSYGGTITVENIKNDAELVTGARFIVTLHEASL